MPQLVGLTCIRSWHEGGRHIPTYPCDKRGPPVRQRCLVCAGRDVRAHAHEKEVGMSDNEHPKGALLFMLIFLMLIVVFWVNTYMRLWLR
jgi:hypothetical protein